MLLGVSFVHSLAYFCKWVCICLSEIFEFSVLVLAWKLRALTDQLRFGAGQKDFGVCKLELQNWKKNLYTFYWGSKNLWQEMFELEFGIWNFEIGFWNRVCNFVLKIINLKFDFKILKSEKFELEFQIWNFEIGFWN